MRLLHFRRTFVEKLFAIHARVEQFKRDGQPVGSYARHYYDLFELAGQPEVVAMLRSDEYAAIKTDYDAVSRAHFASRYVAPPAMRFAESDALFPTPSWSGSSVRTTTCSAACCVWGRTRRGNSCVRGSTN